LAVRALIASRNRVGSWIGKAAAAFSNSPLLSAPEARPRQLQVRRAEMTAGLLLLAEALP